MQATKYLYTSLSKDKGLLALTANCRLKKDTNTRLLTCYILTKSNEWLQAESYYRTIH